MIKELKPAEIILPIILTGLFPLLALVSNTEAWEQLARAEQITRWIVMSSLLLIIWFSNLYIRRKLSRSRFYLKVILWNAILILGFSLIVTQLEALVTGESTLTSLSMFTLIRPGIAAGLILIFQYSLQASKDNARLKNENLALQAEYYKAQLDQLRKQVNPHFLFNSLSTLRTMIREPKNAEKSEQFVLSLSDVYRQLLQTRESDSISLKEELDFLESFLYLLQIRFGESLSVEINVNEVSKQFSIPAFSLQLLVENCIKHNIVSIDNPLKIEIFQNSEEKITVRNNYSPKNSAEVSLGTGLTNLSKRYELIGIEHGVNITQTDDHYSVELNLF